MSAKPARLTRRQAHLLVSIAGAWMPIMCGRDDQRITDGLLRLNLVTAYGYPAPKGEAWHLVPTLLGRALGCLLSRLTGGKLKRAGVAGLAKHRAKLLAGFDVQGSLANLMAERAALLDEKAEREAKYARKEAARG